MTDQQYVLGFDGIDDYVEVKDPFDNNIAFTISLWVKPSRLSDGGWHGFLGKHWGEQYRKPSLWLAPSNNGLHYDGYAVDGSARYGEILDNFFEAKEQWVHIAWVKEGNQYKFYRNGDLFVTKPAPESFHTNKDTSYLIGAVDNYFPGQIAEVQIWNIARTQEQIQKDMNHRLQGDEPGLACYWPFNEGSGETAPDRVKSANHGKIVGATWQQSQLPIEDVSQAKVNLPNNSKIKLNSWKGDYLHRPDSDQGVTTWDTGVGNEWIVESIGDNKIKLKSWKGDYLHRPDSDQGVTTWDTGVGNEWIVESIGDNKIKLKSWKGDYLHRPDSAQGVTTWSTGIGNEWMVEVIGVNVHQPAVTTSQPQLSGRLWAIQQNGVWARWAPEFSRWDIYSETRLEIAADPSTSSACYFIDLDSSVHWLDVDQNVNKSFPGIVAKAISVGGDNRLWAIQQNGVWTRWAPEPYIRWDIYSETRLQIVADPSTPSACYFINPDGSVHWRNVDLDINTSFPGIVAKAISVGGNGRLWAIQQNGVWARWAPEFSRWDIYSETRLAIAADLSTESACYFINPDGSVHWRDVDRDINTSFPGIVAKAISVGDLKPAPIFTPKVEITNIFYKGTVKKTQSDEYVEITNQEKTPADVSGWQIASGVGRNKFFTFPQGTKLAPGQSVRVYTNEVHPESGGYSCGSKLSLWKDSGDEAKLLDAKGNLVFGLAYDSKGNFTKTAS